MPASMVSAHSSSDKQSDAVIKVHTLNRGKLSEEGFPLNMYSRKCCISTKGHSPDNRSYGLYRYILMSAGSEHGGSELLAGER